MPVIKNEQEYTACLRQVLAMKKHQRTPQQEIEFQALVKNVLEYEDVVHNQSAISEIQSQWDWEKYGDIQPKNYYDGWCDVTWLDYFDKFVAVYGSLKRNLPNHGLLRSAEFIDTFKTLPQFTLLDLTHFPGAIENGSTAITIEIYEISPEILAQLDALEGHPTFYKRRKVGIPNFGQAWFYVLSDEFLSENPAEEFKVVESGEW
ncbi:gamma-glutamylcyclotransferase family protein [Aliikangiella sp. IMCC44653]